MEIEKKEVIRASFYLTELQDIFEYGEITFGERAALSFYSELSLIVNKLETQYLLHPECRHLETKDKIYRNIIFGSYFTIYRIRLNKIEVLRSFQSSRSPKDFKLIKKIHL